MLLDHGQEPLAYSSNETGRDEVFVRPFPNTDLARVRISSDGGRGPLWSKDGNELFFVDEDRGLLATSFEPASGRHQSPVGLFTIPAEYPANASNNFYDVSSDGERFLMVRGLADAGLSEVYILTNWFEELRERVESN